MAISAALFVSVMLIARDQHEGMLVAIERSVDNNLSPVVDGTRVR